jgi:HSP20 family protein
VRNLPLPAGVHESGIKASYVDGILEIRVPMGDAQKEAATKIAVERG